MDRKIDFNAIYQDIRSLTTRFQPNALVVIAFEEYTEGGASRERVIRAYVSVDGRVIKFSRAVHKEPVDALLELHQLCGGKLDHQP